MVPWPGAKLHVGVRPAMALPLASFAVTEKPNTAPVRACTVFGVSVNDAMDPPTTEMGNGFETLPTLATMFAAPAFSAETRPAAFTVATDGFELRHATASVRLSPVAENTRLESLNRCPATSFAVPGAISIDAAGPGSDLISIVSNFGRAPASVAVTVTGSVAVEPAVTRPSESTRPSNRALLPSR